MSFLIQYTCPQCGYQSPDYPDALIDPWDMPELYICSCKQCKMMFHRKEDKISKERINKCTHCGSEDIEIHPNMYDISCPECGKNMDVKCVGTCF